MLDRFEVVAIPLEKNSQGVIRVSGTRVSLDSIMYAYTNDGATPEEIVMRFPTCRLEDIYTILSWALNNREEVDVYLAEQQIRRGEKEQEIRRSYQTENLRNRLLMRSQSNR